MAPNETQDRYPKRKRATVNYEIDHSIDGDLDLEDDGNVSEELGEDSTISAGSANSTNAQHRDTITVPEVDSEIEDATFGSRRVKKRKVVAKSKAKSQPRIKRAPKFKPFRLMDLPPELRLKVYEEALVDPHGVHIRAYADRYESIALQVSVQDVISQYVRKRSCYVRGQWSQIPDGAAPKKKYRLSPDLLAASKTVHDEAVSLLWKQPFMFSDITALHTFLLMLRPETISRLRDITILASGWNSNRAFYSFVLLRDAPFLQNLRFDCRVRPETRLRSSGSKDVQIGQQLAAKIYKDCRPFLRALVKHQGAESVLKVFKFHQTEFTKYFFNAATSIWVHQDWSQETQDKALDAMMAELNTIMNRKILPRIPRSRS